MLTRVAIRVLLVDDVSDLRTLFRQALAHDDRILVVAEAGDGIEAIEKAAEVNPDVILLDLAMPRLDGLRAIPRLHEASPGTRILVFSGFSSPKLAARAVASCATGFVEKGIPPHELGDVIEQVFLAPAKSGCSKTPA
jgi:DNA-binding NarL/FixJ family response regulator